MLTGLRPAPSLCRSHLAAGPSQDVVSLPAAATTTAARSPVLARPCLVYGQGTTRDFSAVKGLDGRFGGGVVRHLDEAEASRLPSIPVGDYSCGLHFTVGCESALELFLGHLKRKVAYVNVHTHSLLVEDPPNRCLASHAFYNRLVASAGSGGDIRIAYRSQIHSITSANGLCCGPGTDSQATGPPSARAASGRRSRRRHCPPPCRAPGPPPGPRSPSGCSRACRAGWPGSGTAWGTCP